MNDSIFKVVVADDEYFLRRGISRKINELCPGFAVIGEASNGLTAIDLIEKYLPDIVVTDIKMPIMDGLELMQKVTHNYPNIKKIIISGYSDFEYARQAMKFGVKDYLLKPLEDEQFINVLNKMMVILSSENSGVIINGDLTVSDDYSQIADIIELYITENYSKQITLESLAEQFNFSPGNLSKIFKRYKNDSPHQYILKLRINEAKRLLLNNPNANIKIISSAIGYPDQCYFSRLFKKVTGKNPSEYRLLT